MYVGIDGMKEGRASAGMTSERGKGKEARSTRSREQTQGSKKTTTRQGERRKCSVCEHFVGYEVEGRGVRETQGVEKWKPAALLHDYTENIICIRE